MNEMSAPGGTWLACIVAMVDLVTRDSYANVNAECVNVLIPFMIVGKVGNRRME